MDNNAICLRGYVDQQLARTCSDESLYGAGVLLPDGGEQRRLTLAPLGGVESSASLQQQLDHLRVMTSTG